MYIELSPRNTGKTTRLITAVHTALTAKYYSKVCIYGYTLLEVRELQHKIAAADKENYKEFEHKLRFISVTQDQRGDNFDNAARFF